MIDNFKISELLDYCIDLFDKTSSLYQKTVSTENPSPIVGVYLSEIFTIKEVTNLFLSNNEDIQHYEISSLLSFWNDVYRELKSVIEMDDHNTSWLAERYDNYKGQHEIVVGMLRDL